MCLKAPVHTPWIIFPSALHLSEVTTVLKLVYIFFIYVLVFHNICAYSTYYIALY